MDTAPSLVSDHQLRTHLSTRLHELRINACVSVSYVAQQTGIEVEQIEQYEAAQGDVSAAHLYRLAVCYGVSPQAFFAGLPHTDAVPVTAQDAQHLLQKFLTIDSPDRGERFGQLVAAIRQQQE